MVADGEHLGLPGRDPLGRERSVALYLVPLFRSGFRRFRADYIGGSRVFQAEALFPDKENATELEMVRLETPFPVVRPV